MADSLREKIAREVMEAAQGRVGQQSCDNAADRILAIPEIAQALDKPGYNISRGFKQPPKRHLRRQTRAILMFFAIVAILVAVGMVGANFYVDGHVH